MLGSSSKSLISDKNYYKKQNLNVMLLSKTKWQQQMNLC